MSMCKQVCVHACTCVCVCVCVCVRALSRSVLSDTLGTNRLQPARLLCPWDFPSKNTEGESP